MKKMMLFLATMVLTLVMFITAPVSAEEDKHWTEICSEVSRLAETIMRSHQMGAPMSAVMAVVEGNTIGMQMVVEAYGSPRFSMERNQQRAIAEHRDRWYRICAQAYQEELR